MSYLLVFVLGWFVGVATIYLVTHPEARAAILARIKSLFRKEPS